MRFAEWGIRGDLGRQKLPEVVSHPALRIPHHRFTYVLLNPFLVFVTVIVPFARAEILM